MKPEETRCPGEARFHYDREEREAGLSEYARTNLRTKGSIFRRHKSLRITLIDLVVLVLLVALVSVFLRTRGLPAGSDQIDLFGEVERVGDRLVVTVTVVRIDDESPHGPLRVVIRAVPGDGRVEIHDVLADEPLASKTVRGALHLPEGDDSARVFATVHLAGSSTVLSLDHAVTAPTTGDSR